MFPRYRGARTGNCKASQQFNVQPRDRFSSARLCPLRSLQETIIFKENPQEISRLNAPLQVRAAGRAIRRISAAARTGAFHQAEAAGFDVKGLGETKHEALEPRSAHPQHLSLVCSAELPCSSAASTGRFRLIFPEGWSRLLPG